MKEKPIVNRYYDANGKMMGGCRFRLKRLVGDAFMNAAYAVQSDGASSATITIKGEGTFRIKFEPEGS